MSQISLQVENVEALKLLEGQILGLRFNQGWAVFRIKGREASNLRPWSLGGCSALSNLSAWDEVKDSSDRKYLEPHDQSLIKQWFWGVSPAKARIYLQHATRQNRWSLLAVERSIDGAVGYVDGYLPHGSPFNGPFNPRTEGFTVKGVYPAFNSYNPTNLRMLDVQLNFDVTSYTYRVVKDRTRIKEYITGQRKMKPHVVGGIDPQPVVAPQWLETLNADDEGNLFKYSLQVEEEATT